MSRPGDPRIRIFEDNLGWHYAYIDPAVEGEVVSDEYIAKRGAVEAAMHHHQGISIYDSSIPRRPKDEVLAGPGPLRPFLPGGEHHDDRTSLISQGQGVGGADPPAPPAQSR